MARRKKVDSDLNDKDSPLTPLTPDDNSVSSNTEKEESTEAEVTAPVLEADPFAVGRIFPEVDQREMDRYFCVINNRTTASLISETITHQRDLNLWGVHQFDNESRNSFARSFYFRDRINADKALSVAQKIVAS